MPTIQTSRIFASGDARTLYLTIPAALATDSQFPFGPDQGVTISIEEGRLVVTSDDDSAATGDDGRTAGRGNDGRRAEP